MNLQERTKPDPCVFWTRQAAVVLDEFDEDGRYVVKKEYIEAKNDTIADFYLKLYRWYTREAGKHLTLPQDAEYPIWMSVSDELMLRPTQGTVILKLQIPADSFLYANYDAWGYCVNYMYVPTDEEDKIRHENELKKYGVASDDQLLLTQKGNFYPLLKKQLTDSWRRVFTQPPKDEIAGLVATCWEIRKEWILEVTEYKE
ncbi:MAG: DUF3841 domain-containing protein [Lachnospiraceae bacterium]|nr:DUF3841 domain-containing protein [Lachnospiraceae bacterium]